MSLTILNTPSSIYDAVTVDFIFASLNVTSTNPVEIEINLQPNLPTVHLSSAVDKKQFEYDLHMYYLHMEIADMAHSPIPRPYLDPARFSVPDPLTDWKPFRRSMCVSEGRECIDVIIEFLLDPSHENLLKVSSLGFDPESSTHPLSDVDKEYFKDFPEKISKMNLEKRKEIVKQIELQYPTVFSQQKDKLALLTIEEVIPKQDKEKWSTSTYITIATLVSNISYAILPNQFLLGLNVLLRFSGIVAAVSQTKHMAGISRLINLIAMLKLRDGWMMTSIDLISVGLLSHHYNVLTTHSKKQKPLISKTKLSYPALEKDVQASRFNVKDLEQAYLCISIPESKKNDFEFITTRYNLFRNDALSRQSKISQILADQLQFLIDDYDEAYKTICAHLPPPDASPAKTTSWEEELSLTID